MNAKWPVKFNISRKWSELLNVSRKLVYKIQCKNLLKGLDCQCI